MGNGKNTRKKTIRGRLKLEPTQIIALTFALIILIGACLLTLPIASRSGVSCGFVPALFTATSTTCVTGLVLFDTWTQWSGFGQIVLLLLIETGGLGFMSVASLVVFVLRRKVGLRQRMLIAQALSAGEMDGVIRLQKWVLLGSLTIQATGALILFFRFLPEFGWLQAAKWGVFHAISGFCNAGFDIFGSIAPGQSVAMWSADPVVLLTLAALVIVGGLGFFVWEEVVTLHSFKKFSAYTKLVLITTAVLLIGGTVLIALLEWQNPATLGNMPVWQKLLNAFFQSASLRTAGFASVDQALLTDGGKAVSILLMLVGGSSGSTAGGLKTVTVVVLVLFVLARARGRSRVSVFRRNIPQDKILDAVTITGIVCGLAVVGAMIICTTNDAGFLDGMYETASALATVGLTAGLTPKLNLLCQLMIILFMYFGRVGVLTISLGFLMGDRAQERFAYADTNLLIG